MTIQIALAVGRRNAIQRITHISAHIVIPVLIERQRTASVLHEEVQHADLIVADLWHFGEDMIGDEVGAAAACGEGEVLLKPGHFVEVGGIAGLIESRENRGGRKECWVWGSDVMG